MRGELVEELRKMSKEHIKELKEMSKRYIEEADKIVHKGAHEPDYKPQQEELKYDKSYNLSDKELQILKRLNKGSLYTDELSNNMRIIAIRKALNYSGEPDCEPKEEKNGN